MTGIVNDSVYTSSVVEPLWAHLHGTLKVCVPHKANLGCDSEDGVVIP